MEPNLEPLEKLSKDMRKAATTLSDKEARYLVDTYYIMQEGRKRTDNQLRALQESGEPHDIIQWASKNFRMLENQVKYTLDTYSDAHPVARAAREVRGIGPVIAAGLLAHIDVRKTNTAGGVWRFAGLDPTAIWEKGEKRPWNASLKTLCWKIGESFVKQSGHEDCFYGHLYIARKKIEDERNAKKLFKDQAAIKAKVVKKKTKAYPFYKKGLLPPGHIYSRAKRWAVKLFLAHWFERMYEHELGVAPPKPYVIEHLGHIHQLKCPW